MADENKMNLSIVVDDGSRRVPIMNTNGDEIGVFYFRPTDIGIIDRYNKLTSTFDAITEPLEAASEASGKGVENNEDAEFEAIREAEKRLYVAVNELFASENAAEALFRKMHPFSPVEGNFYCVEVLTAVGRFIGQQFDIETQKFTENVKKYTQNRAQRRSKKK